MFNYGDERKELNLENYTIWCTTIVDAVVVGLRTGQHFCNYFGITDSKLFYCADDFRTWDLITEYLKEIV